MQTIKAKSSSAIHAAITDQTRQQRPSNWHAVVLFASAQNPGDLADKLDTLPPFAAAVTAARYNRSLATIDNDKMAAIGETEQSIEWAEINPLSLPALAAKHNDELLAEVANQSAQLITDIDSALAELEQLKSTRDERLKVTQFEQPNINCQSFYFVAGTDKQLADQVAAICNDAPHQFYCLFVGSAGELTDIKELFGI